MALKAFEVISIVLAALVGGMFWGPWLALSRTMSTFEPETFLAVTHRMTRNMAPLMTALMPAALLSIAPVLLISFGRRPATFWLALAGMALYALALLVTVVIEVPIVTRIATWTAATLPVNWRQLRDRWGAFHVVRVASALAGLTFLVVGALL